MSIIIPLLLMNRSFFNPLPAFRLLISSRIIWLSLTFMRELSKMTFGLFSNALVILRSIASILLLIGDLISKIVRSR